MYKTVYQCDICEKEVNKNGNKEELTKVSVSIVLEERKPVITKELCDDCLAELGITDKSDNNYITNYCNLQKNFMETIKKLVKWRNN